MLTMKQLRKFVKTRNTSGFSSNLQFQIDANACGFEVKDLGDVEKFTLDGFGGYRWTVPTKDRHVMLIEFGRRLYLNGEGDPDTISMMSLMHKAQWQDTADA